MTKQEKKSQGIYAVHIVDGDVDYTYIGSGFLGDRTSGNPSKLKRNKHDNPQLQAIYNKVGNCYVEILKVCKSKQEARDLENEYIAFFRLLEGMVVCNVDKAVTVKKEYKIVLNAEKVLEIKKLLDEGKLKQYQIAEMYNVNQPQISKINTMRRWANVIQEVDFD